MPEPQARCFDLVLLFRNGNAPSMCIVIRRRNNEYLIWSPHMGDQPQWSTQDSFVLMQHREDPREAIRLIRESELNPPAHGLLLVQVLDLSLIHI